MEVPLQIRQLAGQVFELVVGDHADVRILQGHGVAGVPIGADAVQAQQLARHLKTGDLIPPVFR